MGATEKDVHRPWLAYALEESLEHALLTPKDVIDHANPEVLVNQLPPPVISVLLSRALAIGTFSAAQVLESAPPALLAEHLNPEVMWLCLKDAAERGGISRVGGARTTRSRQWFASVLGRALESSLITPADVLRFLPPSEFVSTAPKSVLAELLKEGLVRAVFEPGLVLEHITPTVIAENLETSLVWDCISEAARRHFELSGTTKASGIMATKSPALTPPPAAVSTSAAGTLTTKVNTKPLDRPSAERPVVTAPVDDKTPSPTFIAPPPGSAKVPNGATPADGRRFGSTG